MAEFRKYVYALAIVALLAGLTVPASAQAFSCAATTVPVNLRAEGMTELAGDIIIDCSGGNPAAASTVLPQVNITISTSVALTSKITNTVSTGATTIGQGIFDEAILIADQPNTTTWSVAAAAYGGPRNILNCGNAGAPDTNPATGAGICAILATGNKFDTYDGTPNGLPAGTTCTATSTPTGGAIGYGCGRPNVFQGRQDINSLIGPQQRVVFLDVPIDQPGAVGGGVPGVTIPPNCDSGGLCHHFYRITNIRVNAANLGGGGGGIVSGIQVFADITVSNQNTLPINNVGITNNGIGTLLIGRVNTTLGAPTGTPGTLALVGCKDNNQAVGSVTFNELIADAWKPRNVSLLLANNTGGGGAPPFATPLYNLLPGIAAGTTAAIWDSGDCRQNVPGTNYETEAGFQNSLPTLGFPGNTAGAGANCAGGIPNPNPPNGLSLGAVGVPPGNSAFSDNSGVTGNVTGIQNAGIASSGTRLVMNIQNVFGAPNVVDVRVPAQVVLKNRSNGKASGVAILQSYATGCTPNVTNPAADQGFCPDNAGYPGIGPFGDGTVSITTVPNNQAGAGLCTTTAGVAIAGSACSASIAFYEIVFADPGVFEQLVVPFFVDYTAANISLQPPVNPTPIAIATGLGYGPFYSNSAPQSFATFAALPATGGAGASGGKPAVSAGFPYPRFIPGIGTPVNLFSISGKCVCDLLFPYVTDVTILPGSAFDTGISIANTSRDPGSVQRALGAGTKGSKLGTFGFALTNGEGNSNHQGISDDTTVVTNEQTGPVQFWYYATQPAAANGATINFVPAGNPAQGNTQCTNVAIPGLCNDLDGNLTLNTGTNVPAGGVLGMSVKNGSTPWGLLADPSGGFSGYVIAQASFQYCHGVAFVSTNGLASVTGLTIPSLSYQALSLDNNQLDFRTATSGEGLVH